MIFLHHYPASLFSEKVRLLLGHYGLEWHSVEIPSIMPRPLLMPLSGGYRRTPVLQIGANVYADTKIICKALARHVGDEALYRHGFAAHRTADWADTQLFRVTVALNFRPEALAPMMGQFSEAEAAAFAKDRAELAGGQPIATLSPAAALAYLDHALSELDQTLAGGAEYQFGPEPSIADFSVFHNLWFLNNNSVNAPLVENYREVVAWFERMSAIGHGRIVESDAEAALAAARESEPTPPDLVPGPLAPFAVGDTVAVTPVDYGRVPVVGELVAQSQDEIVIRRETLETGTVFNHFPQPGFEVSTPPA
ncbi:MAG: glutathione S-transferase family protein [Gammaproteobacteria bacterium]